MFALVKRSPRALTRYEPTWQPWSYWLDELEKWAGDVWESWPSYGYRPYADIYEEKGYFVVKMELPGISKEDIYITFEGDYLVIKAEKKEAKTAKDTRYYSCERYYGQYYRRFSLPYPVDTGKCSATYENGILEVRCPKTETTETRQIEVKVK